MTITGSIVELNLSLRTCRNRRCLRYNRDAIRPCMVFQLMHERGLLWYLPATGQRHSMKQQIFNSL